MKKLILILVMMLAMGSIVSCSLFTELFEAEVITTEDNVLPGREGDIVYVPLDQISPEHQKQLEEAGKRLVIVPKDAVRDLALPTVPLVPVEGDGSSWESITDLALGVANTLWPGVAILEGFGVLFSRRKRRHYGEAVKAITPMNGAVNLREAIVSLVRAVGFAHSSEDSKVAFEKPKTEPVFASEPGLL